MVVDDAGGLKGADELFSYGQTKVGNCFLTRTHAKTTPETGVLHAAFNSGNLKAELRRHWRGIDITFMVSSPSCS